MAGVQSAKARLQSLVNSPEQASYHNSPPPFEPRSAGSPHPSQHKRDTSVSRGRIPILPANGSSNLHAQIQLPGRAVSPRVSPSNGEQSTRGGGLERRPSANYGHHRQTSIVHGLPQHSRNSSLAKSPALSHRSPQLPTSSHTPNGFLNDTLGFSPLFTSSPDFQPFMSPLSTGSSVLSTPSSITAGARETTRDGNGSEATFSTQRKMDRKPSGKVKREHGNSHTKHQAEQVTVGECALQHLFHMFINQADFKITQCVSDVPDSEPRVEDVCGPGVDLQFDQLISALGHIARQKPRPLVDNLMFWRQSKGVRANVAQETVAQFWNRGQAQPPLPRRTTEPVHSLDHHSGNLAESYNDSRSGSLASLQEQHRQATRALQLSNYLLCRVLIEVYHQTESKYVTPLKFEDRIFEQLERMEPEKLQNSAMVHSLWTIYGILLGVISASNFHSVSHQYLVTLQHLQDSAGAADKSPSYDARISLFVMAMKHLTIKTQPESSWKESCELLHTLGKFFVNSHGQPIKHAYCQVLENLVFPIASSSAAPSSTSQLSSPQWKDFLNTVNARLTQMLMKPKHWPEAFPLSSLLLCASPLDAFNSQWLTVATTLQAKLKDKLTRSCALQAISRLVWTYLHRTTEPVQTITRKLEDVVKIVLPTGKKTYLTTEPAFAEPIIELIRIIGYRYPKFCFDTVVFPLINSELFTSGREIKVEQLEPERIVVGIRAFLAIMTDLENVYREGPPFPRFGVESTTPRAVYITKSANMPQSNPGARRRRIQTEASSKPFAISKLDDVIKEYYSRFCEILGKITLICDNAFGGQAVLDEKFGGQTPKTPITESFTFGRKDEHGTAIDQKQGFYDLLHVAVQALPRCLSNHIPFNSLINLLCTGTAHVQSNIAVSSARSLKAIAQQAHAQPVTIGFARFIFNFDSRYSTMSDDGMLGPGHIENTLQLYLELLRIWIEEIKLKIKSATSESLQEGSSSIRAIHMDLTSISAVVEEVESHGVFFLCSQSRRVRGFAVSVLRLVTEFDMAMGRDHPRIIQLLEGDLGRIIDTDDDRLSVAERSRLQKEKRKSSPQNTLIELCSSNVSYDSTLWSKIFPNLIRLAFEMCPFSVTLGRDSVCARLLQMHELITLLSEGNKAPPSAGLDRVVNRLGSTPPEVVIEQWKLYLVMACTTLTNAGAQTQSQLAITQHARNKSKTYHGQDKISSARALFAYIIPLLSAGPSSIRDAIVTALGSININLYKTLLESLQYAVTTCNEEAKLRVGSHQRTGSSPRKNRRTDRLRTEVTHVYKLTSKFLNEPDVLCDDSIVTNLIRYTDDMRVFLSDTTIQNDWEFQTLRIHYCGLMEEVFEGINRTKEPSKWMSFEARKAAFNLMEDWCGHSPNQNQVTLREDSMRESALNQHRDTGERTNITAAIEIEKRNLRTAALSAMASLCGGPISVISERTRGPAPSFDVRRMLSWIDLIFGTVTDRMHLIGRRALTNLIVHNKSHTKLLEHSIDRLYVAERPKALESYFEVITHVLLEHVDYPLTFWRILGAVLFTLGNQNGSIRIKSARLLRTLEERQQKSSKLQDFDISISDKTTAVYKLAQFEISKRLAKQHSDLAFFVFSQFSQHYKNIHPDHQRNMIAAILPWIQVIELEVDPNGGPTAPTYMLLANMLEITTKSSSTLHNEVQALWQALATGPHGGNVQLVLDFVISLCIDRREQSFVDYAKQIIVFLSSTPAGQKVVDFLLLQITPRNMVYTEKPKPKEISPDTTGLPYIADLGEALPAGSTSKQSGLSLGQLSLILLVDLMVAPLQLSKESVPLLLQICIVLWDHYTLLVQEQAREMLVHLIHELVISKIADDSTTPKKAAIEEFVEAIRQSKSTVVWGYQESNGKQDASESSRVPTSMAYVALQVIDLFSLSYPTIHEQWSKTALSWATACSVRHLACRSFQIFRCILSSLDQPMLADMLTRLSNTISDDASEVKNFSMEILTTLRTIIGALEPTDLIKYPQLFWATCACLQTVNECEFVEALGMLSSLLDKMDLSDPGVVNLLVAAKPENWEGQFEGIVPLLYKGLKSEPSLQKTLTVLIRTVALPRNELTGDQSRLLFAILAYLPSFLHSLDYELEDTVVVEAAQVLSTVAENDTFNEISIVLNAYAHYRYTSSDEFLGQILSTIRQSFFPTWDLRSLIFLMGLLTNRLDWYRLKLMDILCVLIPDINIRRPEIAGLGVDLISPLLRLLQTEYCPRALEVMDHIMIVSTTPMDKEYIRMSMLSPGGSRTARKEYEKTQSLYGIPEESGWSIPMPAIYAYYTRKNVAAVFCTCVNPTASAAEAPAATPEIEFTNEEHMERSYFPMDRSETMTSEETQIDDEDLDPTPMDGRVGDLVSKLDSLDDFFDDNNLSPEDQFLNRYSDVTVTGYALDIDLDFAETPSLYNTQPASQSLTNNPSTSSLHNAFTTPFSHESFPPFPSSYSLPSTSTTTRPPPPLPTDPSLSDPDLSDLLSDDERSSSGPQTSGPMPDSNHSRRVKSVRRLTPVAGVAGRQGELLRGQSRGRSKSQAAGSPEVPKVPEAFLVGVVRLGEG